MDKLQYFRQKNTVKTDKKQATKPQRGTEEPWIYINKWKQHQYEKAT